MGAALPNELEMMPNSNAMERQPIQQAAGSLAASAFVATTQILTRDSLDLPLQIALVLFAVNIPFQIILFFMPIPFTIEETKRMKAESRSLSWPQWFWSVISMFSTPAIVVGFVAMFWHFHWWVGVLFGLAAWGAYRIYRYCAWEDFKKRSVKQDSAS
jgi:hypothetical protein